MSVADRVRDKARKLLDKEKSQGHLDPGQLMLFAWLLREHDARLSLDFLELALDKQLARP